MLLMLIILLSSVLLFQRPDVKSNQMIPLCHIATNVLLQYVKSSLLLSSKAEFFHLKFIKATLLLKTKIFVGQ